MQGPTERALSKTDRRVIGAGIFIHSPACREYLSHRLDCECEKCTYRDTEDLGVTRIPDCFNKERFPCARKTTDECGVENCAGGAIILEIDGGLNGSNELLGGVVQTSDIV